KAPTSGTPTIPDTSTTSARGAPPFLVTPTPKSFVSFKKPPLAGSHSARLPKAKSKSPRPWQHGSHPSKKYGSSARAQKPPCPPSAWPGALPAGPKIGRASCRERLLGLGVDRTRIKNVE